MFNNKSYHIVNREERHFGFLFTSALIYDECFRQKIFARIVSGNTCVFVEVKIESGAGSNDHGYDQIEIQKLISCYMKLLIPTFEKCTFYNSSLTVANEIGLKGITWKDVVCDLSQSTNSNAGSAYIYECLSQLERYSFS